jgi:hypothetical protein
MKGKWKSSEEYRMKKQRIIQLLIWGLFVMGIQACSKPKVISPRDIVIGEMRNGSPKLTYPDYDRLKSAMALAFPEGNNVDTAFLHVSNGPKGYSEIVLTAIGISDAKGTEAVPTSGTRLFLCLVCRLRKPTNLRRKGRACLC